MAKVATAITPKELLEVWQQHCYFEFVKKDAKAALGSMSDNPYVLAYCFGCALRGVDRTLTVVCAED